MSTRQPPAGGCSFSVPQRAAYLPRCTRHMDDDETMIDAEFERTQPIGNALHALAQAELAVAAVDELDPAIHTRLHRIIATVTDEAL